MHASRSLRALRSVLRRSGVHAVQSAKRVRSVAIAALTIASSGCFSYVYHDRGARPDFRVPIDENAPHSDIRWSLWWSTAHVWKPIGCFYADGSTHYVDDDSPDPKCQRYFPLCEHGVGRTEVHLLVYSIPSAIVTLGMAMPAEATVYCSVVSEPNGPSGPQ
jgi:hypothetical protein